MSHFTFQFTASLSRNPVVIFIRLSIRDHGANGEKILHKSNYEFFSVLFIFIVVCEKWVTILPRYVVWCNAVNIKVPPAPSEDEVKLNPVEECKLTLFLTATKCIWKVYAHYNFALCKLDILTGQTFWVLPFIPTVAVHSICSIDLLQGLILMHFRGLFVL